MKIKWLVFLIPFVFIGCSQKQEVKPYTGKPFAYYPAGLLSPSHSGKGRQGDNYVYALGIRFPLENAPAYLNSQVYGVGGLHGPKEAYVIREIMPILGEITIVKNVLGICLYVLEEKDTKGVDIRPATCEKKKHYAVAVEKGIITYIGSYTVKLRGDSGRTYRYLHLDSHSLQVRKGQHIQRGQRIGLVSNNMGGTPTSIHLHFDMKQTIKIGNTSKSIFVPPYTSLVEAYKRLIDGNP